MFDKKTWVSHKSQVTPKKPPQWFDVFQASAVWLAAPMYSVQFSGSAAQWMLTTQKLVEFVAMKSTLHSRRKVFFLCFQARGWHCFWYGFSTWCSEKKIGPLWNHVDFIEGALDRLWVLHLGSKSTGYKKSTKILIGWNIAVLASLCENKNFEE